MHDYTRCAYPVRLALENAPTDDEPDDDDFDGGLSEARADMQGGRTTSTEELLRRLGIDERSSPPDES